MEAVDTVFECRGNTGTTSRTGLEADTRIEVEANEGETRGAGSELGDGMD